MAGRLNVENLGGDVAYAQPALFALDLIRGRKDHLNQAYPSPFILLTSATIAPCAGTFSRNDRHSL